MSYEYVPMDWPEELYARYPGGKPHREPRRVRVPAWIFEDPCPPCCHVLSVDLWENRRGEVRCRRAVSEFDGEQVGVRRFTITEADLRGETVEVELGDPHPMPL